ncbi:amino acid kinase family protein [Azohydromonas caseinilytica]|uniref:Aspartate kinase n=1 Tax=Azohydromonas caseinilytica TaxID=2728836 RepID=A0A848F8E7_9BURK|nr:aspartate kinase [Azohydromonas caseinilytica]NML15834.1 aspartate kinase [Azohydromonas caseinilytica]
MWVVKLGGSLQEDAPQLRRWLELLGSLGRGRVVIVPGGGPFVEQVRQAQAAWGFDDLAAHNMAILGMGQSALLLRALQPSLQLAGRDADIRRALRAGKTALWMPLELLREHADELTSWDVTSDSLALWLALRLNAERVVVVKSCALDPSAGVQALADAGVLDARFAAMAAGAGCGVDVVEKGALEEMRALLVGGCRHAPA